MLILRLLDILSITLAALVMGVFWGPWLALTRSMRTLAPEVFLVVVHRLDKNLGAIMGVLFPVTMLALIAVSVLSFGHPVGFSLTVAAFALFLVALVVTAAVEALPHHLRLYPDLYAHEVTRALIAAGLIAQED